MPKSYELARIFIVTISCLPSHVWDLGKQFKPRSGAAERASGHGLHYLLTGISIRNKIKMKKYTKHP